MARKCFICKKPNVTYSAGIKAHCGSVDCRTALGLWLVAKQKKASEKVERKKHREAKAKLNDTVPYWIKKTQVVFNRYIRIKDSKMPCISCDKPASYSAGSVRGSGWDCGHYRSVGSAPELRFEILNAHKQCVKCNQYLSGNVVEYRIELARRIGPKNLEWLEGPHPPKRYRVPELKEIHKRFKDLAKGLENESNQL